MSIKVNTPTNFKGITFEVKSYKLDNVNHYSFKVNNEEIFSSHKWNNLPDGMSLTPLQIANFFKLTIHSIINEEGHVFEDEWVSPASAMGIFMKAIKQTVLPLMSKGKEITQNPVESLVGSDSNTNSLGSDVMSSEIKVGKVYRSSKLGLDFIIYTHQETLSHELEYHLHIAPSGQLSEDVKKDWTPQVSTYNFTRFTSGFTPRKALNSMKIDLHNIMFCKDGTDRRFVFARHFSMTDVKAKLTESILASVLDQLKRIPKESDSEDLPQLPKVGMKYIGTHDGDCWTFEIKDSMVQFNNEQPQTNDWTLFINNSPVLTARMMILDDSISIVSALNSIKKCVWDLIDRPCDRVKGNLGEFMKTDHKPGFTVESKVNYMIYKFIKSCNYSGQKVSVVINSTHTALIEGNEGVESFVKFLKEKKYVNWDIITITQGKNSPIGNALQCHIAAHRPQPVQKADSIQSQFPGMMLSEDKESLFYPLENDWESCPEPIMNDGKMLFKSIRRFVEWMKVKAPDEERTWDQRRFHPVVQRWLEKGYSLGLFDCFDVDNERYWWINQHYWDLDKVTITLTVSQAKQVLDLMLYFPQSYISSRKILTDALNHPFRNETPMIVTMKRKDLDSIRQYGVNTSQFTIPGLGQHIWETIEKAKVNLAGIFETKTEEN